MTDRPELAPDATHLQWTVHPAAGDPARSALLVLIVALAAAVVWALTRSVMLTALAGALMLASLRAWFLPRTYRLDGEGAAESGPLQAPRRLLWSDVRRVTPERHGVHLSPLHRQRAILPDRGLFLRTAGDNQRVVDFVRARQAPA